MAENAAPAPPMDLEPKDDDKIPGEVSVNGGEKRSREEDGQAEQKEEKRAKPEEPNNGGEDVAKEINSSGGATVGPISFGSSVEMFDYFYKLLHSWTPNLNLNRYEHSVLAELLKNGHEESERKIGTGIKAFQVRFHPRFRSRCFYLTREDESVDDFSFRKCVDHILPLPENMQVKHQALRGNGGGRRRGGGGGCGRGRVWK